MKPGTFPISRLLILCSLILSGIILSSCNLRENMLLPPNLDPKEYIVESTIRVYSDHLIKSSNDDAYLYIPKESIADSLLWYNDRIRLQKVIDLTERDSLAFDSSLTLLSDTYQISILRDSVEVILDSIPGFATLYTDSRATNPDADSYLLSLQYIPQAVQTPLYSYGSSRIFFDLDGSGDFLLSSGPSDTPSLSYPESSKEIQALLFDDDLYLQAWIPSAFSTELGPGSISVEKNLDYSSAHTAQELFPGFALQSNIVHIQTQNPGNSDSVPILHLSLSQEKSWATQWLKLSDTELRSWPEGPNTWLIEDNKLISFVNGSGSYFLVKPITGQSSIELSLDSPYRQIFLQDIWLDLRDVKLPGYSLKLNTSPPVQELYESYFEANPFTISGSSQAYSIAFYNGTSLVESLPGDAWIEFGFASGLRSRASNRLMRVFRSQTADHLDYKTLGSSYDDTHYSLSDGYVYSGVKLSGTYLYASISESNTTLSIPVHKANLYLQTERTLISWKDNQLACNNLNLSYDTNVLSSHPWLGGMPYTLSSSNALLAISTDLRSRGSDALPDGLYLETRLTTNPESIVNFSDKTDYPKFFRYRRASDFAHNSYVMDQSILKISPAVSGWLIDASQLRKLRTNRALALFSRMIFDDYDLELYLDNPLPMPQPSTMQISDNPSLTDRLGVLASQYQLSHLTGAYSFQIIGNPAFYSQFNPYIRIKHDSRDDLLLLSITDDDFYRIYSYPETESPTGYSFAMDDGHVAFYLAHDGQFALVADQNPHTETVISAVQSQDNILSLYQAQLTMPVEHIGSIIPTGAQLRLKNLGAEIPGLQARSIYQVRFLDNQSNPINTFFYSHPEFERWPYLYIPVPDYQPGENIRLFYRNPVGVVTEFVRVPAFDEQNPANEFVMVGNSAVCFVNNPGLFYTTSDSRRPRPRF